MSASICFSLAASAVASERTLVVPAKGASSLSLTCVVGRATRVLLPEPLRRLKGLGPAREALGVTVEQSSPEAILVIHPRRHPARGTIDFQGPSLELHLDIASATEADGDARDVRIVVEDPAPDETPTEAMARPATDGPPPRSPEEPPKEPGATAIASPTATTPTLGGLDMTALLAAKPVRIHRREGLPGQPELILLDALEAPEWTFFRMRLQDGAQAGVRSVTWDGTAVDTYAAISEGSDLLVVVQLPREQVDGHTHLELTTGTGIVYRIKTSPPTLPARIRDLFH